MNIPKNYKEYMNNCDNQFKDSELDCDSCEFSEFCAHMSMTRDNSTEYIQELNFHLAKKELIRI